MGRPGVDFPVLPQIPRTEFSCRKVKKSGYYADLDTGCQVFHVCDGGRKISFLCPNGTIFRQSHLICDWWFRVDCERSVELYEESAELLAHDQMIYKKRAEELARAMKTSTVPSTTERESNFKQARRRNEKPEKLVELPTANQSNFTNNQVLDTINDENKGTSFRNNQATNTFQASNTFQTANTFPAINTQTASSYNQNQAAFVYSTNPSAPSTSTAYQEQGTTHFGQTAPASFNTFGNLPNNQFAQATSVGVGAQVNPQTNSVASNYQSIPGSYSLIQNTGPSGSQAYQQFQQVNNDFNNQLGLTSSSPQINTFPQTNGNTNYKFSYTASGPSSTAFAAQSNDFTNNQVFSQQSKPALLQEKERQVPAETASFAASNRHRFGNQIEQNYFKTNNPYYTATPSTTTEDFSTTTQRGNYNTGSANYNAYTQQNVQSTVYSTKAPSTTKTVNRGSLNYQNSFNSPASSPATTLVPSSSQVYNSHMQPYSSLNQNNNQNIKYKSSSTQGIYSTWKTSSPTAPTYSSTGKDNYKGEGSSPSFSTFNSFSTGQGPPNFNSLSQVKASPSSTAKPYRGKTVFNVKIKSNKDYSLLELHRQPTNAPSSTVDFSTTQPPVTVVQVSSYATSSSQDKNTPSAQKTTYPSQKTHTPASTQLTTSYSPQTSTILTTPQHKYATVNITGTPEEIRPEIVNSLMESGIKPTAANSLHTFASYYGSAETKDDDSFETFTTARGRVSDVILNLGGSNSQPLNYTTVKPPTSTNGDALPSVLTKNTKDSYSYLFSDSKEQSDYYKDDLTPKESGSAISDFTKTTKKQIHKETIKTTLRATEPTTSTTTPKPEESTHKFRDSSELRELAQVFSRALSAYLEDPETFKEILAQVRPTEPNPSDNTTPNPDDEVLDFSDASQSRTGTTEPPGTTIFNSDDVTADISIGEINNLVSSSKSVGADTSFETNSISPISSESIADIEFTTQLPTVAPEINSVSSGSNVEYFSKLGSAEDLSYFPTAGSVHDNSRPRYGGFHNNTNEVSNSYSPYGADLRNNVTTGTPISESTTVSIPSTTPPYTTQYPTLETTTLNPSVAPAAQQVNNLVSSHNILYGTTAQFTSSSEDTFDHFTSNEQEKLLETSGSQSLVASQNYADFAKNFNNNGQKLYGKDTYLNYATSAVAAEPSAIGNDYLKSDLIPYFGQEPPFETMSEPSAFQTQIPAKITFGDKILKNSTGNKDYNSQASFNSYTISSQTNVINKNLLDGKNVITDRMGTVSSSVGTENSVSQSATWTASPYETTQYISSSSVDVSPTAQKSSTSSINVKPTTYHPLQSSPSSEPPTEAAQYETTAVPTTTVQEITTTTDKMTWPTTVSPENPEYGNLMQAKAKEMFGMLNETAATMLMDVMHQAESNMTLRRLVLLLVNEKNKENKTAEQSKINLINALLTHENDIEETTTVFPSSTAVPKKKVMKIMRVRSGGGRSMKIQRALDNQTAVAGSNSFRNATEQTNKANAAKLYIPTGPGSPKTTTHRPPPTIARHKLPYDSDARALELLKTLYNLAAKWG